MSLVNSAQRHQRRFSWRLSHELITQDKCKIAIPPHSSSSNSTFYPKLQFQCSTVIRLKVSMYNIPTFLCIMYNDVKKQKLFFQDTKPFSICVLVYRFSKQKNVHLGHFTNSIQSWNLIIQLLSIRGQLSCTERNRYLSLSPVSRRDMARSQHYQLRN